MVLSFPLFRLRLLGSIPIMGSCSCRVSSWQLNGLRLRWLNGYSRLQLGGHIGRSPVPVEPAVAGHALSDLCKGVFPTAAEHQASQHQHPFSIVLLPKDA